MVFYPAIFFNLCKLRSFTSCATESRRWLERRCGRCRSSWRCSTDGSPGATSRLDRILNLKFCSVKPRFLLPEIIYSYENIVHDVFYMLGYVSIRIGQNMNYYKISLAFEFNPMDRGRGGGCWNSFPQTILVILKSF